MCYADRHARCVRQQLILLIGLAAGWSNVDTQAGCMQRTARGAAVRVDSRASVSVRHSASAPDTREASWSRNDSSNCARSATLMGRLDTRWGQRLKQVGERYFVFVAEVLTRASTRVRTRQGGSHRHMTHRAALTAAYGGVKKPRTAASVTDLRQAFLRLRRPEAPVALLLSPSAVAPLPARNTCLRLCLL